MTDRERDYEHDRRRHLPQLPPRGHSKTSLMRWAIGDGPDLLLGHPEAQMFLKLARHAFCPECHGTGWCDEGRPCEHP